MIRRYAPRILAAVISTYLSVSLIDFYLAAKLPPVDFRPAWPTEFRPGIGFIFPPRSVVGCTDGFEFAVAQTSNSLGFLDRERSLEKPDGTLRVLVLGDSFVEACQVAIDEKFTSLLERRLNEALPERPFEVIAMGHSGNGTVGGIVFYDAYGRHFDPDLVIVVFVSNDFANDSSILEAVRNGWHPDHPPRVFLERVAGSKGFRKIPVDPEFWKHTLTERRPRPESPVMASLRRYLGWSGLFRWVSKRFEARNQQAEYYGAMEENLKALRGLGGDIERQLEGWHYPDDSDLDYMFYADEMPEVFQSAVRTTAFAMGTFSEKLAAEDRRLLVVAVDSLSFDPPPSPNGRRLRADGYLSKLGEITAANDIPLLDLHDVFREKGNPRKAHWTYDGHWNQMGHRWASEALFDYLQEHRELIRGRKSADRRPAG